MTRRDDGLLEPERDDWRDEDSGAPSRLALAGACLVGFFVLIAWFHP